MTAAELLEAVRDDGLSVRADGTRLRVKGPDAAVDRWQSDLVAQKVDIIALLSGIEGGGRHLYWLIWRDDEASDGTTVPAATAAQARGCFDADRVEARPAPRAVTALPEHVQALATLALRLGALAPEDASLLPAMRARDPAAFDLMIERMVDEVRSCGRCAHSRRPGGTVYCAERADLPTAYGALRHLPADRGSTCRQFFAIGPAPERNSEAQCGGAR